MYVCYVGSDTTLGGVACTLGDRAGIQNDLNNIEKPV